LAKQTARKGTAFESKHLKRGGQKEKTAKFLQGQPPVNEANPVGPAKRKKGESKKRMGGDGKGAGATGNVQLRNDGNPRVGM